ncbi:MAG: hypothetical protein ACYSUX_04085, partial [Planctomycetota bacterium]
MARQSILLLAVVVLAPVLSEAGELTSVAGAAVRLDDSLLREIVNGTKNIIERISPFAVAVFVFIVILIIV